MPRRVKSGRWRSATVAEHGAGSIRGSAAATEHRHLDRQPDNEVQAALAEAAHWLLTLVSAIFSRNCDVRMPKQHLLGACPENLSTADRQERRSHKASLRIIAQKFSHTKMLAQDRDSGKRAHGDMDIADQLLLEDFDTSRLHKRKKKMEADRLPKFRTTMSSAIAAADDIKYQ